MKFRAAPDGELLHHLRAQPGGNDARLRRIDRHHIIGDQVARLERRPPTTNLRAVDPFVGHTLSRQARRIRAVIDRGVGGKEVDAARDGDHALATLRLDRAPRVVCVSREAHVLGRVVRAPDDSRVIVRRAAHVSEFELLEAHHVDPTASQPVRGSGTESAQTNYCNIGCPCVGHARNANRTRS